MGKITIGVEGKATVVGTEITVADTFHTRLFGLLGKNSLAAGEGLWINPSSGVHTFWMRMAIDVVALDKQKRVVTIGHSVRPWRLSGLRRDTRSVLELPAGRARECGLQIGDRLLWMSEG